MHPKNRHLSGYHFPDLISSSPEMVAFVTLNKYHDQSIDFTNPRAVKALNKALLKRYYGVENWDIPDQYLCPPVPGRADYIHYLADLIGARSDLKGLDIGTGANCIYPIIGMAEYGWTFVGSDIDPEALKVAQKNAKIELRLQKSADNIFVGVISEDDHFDFTMCNPPFHASQSEAAQGTQRKWKNLGKGEGLNFGGKANELWTPGGEKAFISKMIQESYLFRDKCGWFTTLVSKESNLPLFKKLLQNRPEIKVIEMSQGQKISRILAWRWPSQ